MIDYVFIKLTTGEQLMATLETEDGSHVAISNPMLLRLIPYSDNGKIQEHVTATPFCQFSEGDDFILPKTSIMFIKQLSSKILDHYKLVVKQYETAVLRPSNQKSNLSWDEEEEDLTVDSINERIDRLESIFAGELSEEAEDESEKVFVEGNDTLH